MGRTAGFVTGKKKRFACGLLAAGVLAAITVLMPVAVFADEADTNSQTEAVSQAGGVVFSTDYPGITVKPGGASTFPLYITNTGSKETTVALEAEDLPEGWEGAFKNTSNEVSMVHVGAHQKKENSPSLSYSLTVPEDAKEDTYTITLNAKGGSVNEELKLSVKVDAEEKKLGVDTFTTDYAQQEGPAGTKFSYTAKLTNNSGENQTYSMSVQGAPRV